MVNQRKSIIITHIVNPHHFYYKYLQECIGNKKFTKLDFEIQNYGNELHSNQSFPNGYTPIEDDLVIFFHLIFNKWVRGKVISIGENITLWCMDNGTSEKSAIQHILPLNPKYYENLNLIHLGGLSLLPAEKTFNIHTTSIEMQPINMWTLELISIFKLILNNSKVVHFTDEFSMSNHTFGVLEVDANGTTFEVNEKFLEMNKAMKTDRSAQVISIYVSKFRLEDELQKSVEASSSIVNNNRSSTSLIMESKTADINSTVTTNNSLSQSELEVSTWINQSVYDESTDFDDSASMMLPKNNFQESTTNGHKLSTSMDHRKHETGHSATPNNKIDSDYICRLGMSSFTDGDCKVRPPLTSTMDWISSHVKSNRRRLSVEKASRPDESSTDSSIVNLNDNADSHQSICSTSSNESETVRNKKIMAMLAANKTRTIEKSTGLNGILQKFTSKVDDKIVNKPTSRLNAIPAGYQLNALHTFGGSTKM